MRKKKKGMSLVEMMISIFILVAFLSSLFWMLPAAKVMWQASANRAANRQGLQLAAWEIAQELRDGNPGSVSTGGINGGIGFSFQSAYTFQENDLCSDGGPGLFCTDSSGNPLWQKYVLYCVPAGGTRLVRLELDSGVPACSASGKLISPSISLFSLVYDPFAMSGALTLEGKSANAQGKMDEQSITMTIFMRD